MRRILRRTKFGRTRRVGKYSIVDADGLHRVWEETHLRRMLADLDIDCVFDVGANRGQYYDMLRGRCQYRGLVISFEPNPILAQALRQRSRSDPLWHVEGVALSGEPGLAPFTITRDDQFSSFHEPMTSEVALFIEQTSSVQQITVSCETLTGAFARLVESYGFERPFLKLDTQGHDTQVAASGSEVMNRFCGLQSELSFKRIYSGSVHFNEALQLYREYGFELSAIVPNNAGHYPLLVEADCIMVRQDLLCGSKASPS